VLPRDAEFPEPASNLPLHRRDANPPAGRPEDAAAVPPRESAMPPALASGPDLAAILRGVKRRWLTVFVLGGGLAALAGVAAWFLLPARYTALSQVQIAENQGWNFKDSPLGGTRLYQTYVKTQAMLMRSRPVINKALGRDDVKRLNLLAQHDDPAAWLEEEIKIEPQEFSELVPIRLEDADPVKAVTLVKALVESYMDVIVYADEAARRKKFTDLESLYNEETAKFNAKQKRVGELADALGTTDKGQLTQIQLELLSTLSDLKKDRAQARAKLAEYQSSLNAIIVRARTLADAVVTDSAVEAALETDAQSKDKVARASKLRDLVEDYERKGAYNEPTYLVKKYELADLKKSLDSRRTELRDELEKRARKETIEKYKTARVEYEMAVNNQQRYLDGLEEEIKKQGAKAANIGKTSAEFDLALSEADRIKQLANELLAKVENQRMELKAQPRISVYQPADLQKRDAKKQILATALSPVAVFIMVCMAIGWWECRQRRVYSADQVASGLGIPVVGAVPDLPNLERRLVGAAGGFDLEGHPVVESIDAIRTTLLRDANAGMTRVVLVTSAVAGEGKTTLASHLAGSLARAGRKTLLIDGDLRSPAAHQLFEVPLQPGFSEVLLGEVETADAVQATTLEGLSVIPAGQWDREVMQALARDGMQGVFERLKEEFDFIVVDSHPVLAATDALLLGQQVDAVLLSVLRDVSRTPRVYAACQRLTALGIRLLGAVVNGADPTEVVAGPAPYAQAAVR
jgi:capsular exopolysaccharide synthesis family protein